MISPQRPLWTPSGLIMTNVDSAMLTTNVSVDKTFWVRIRRLFNHFFTIAKQTFKTQNWNSFFLNWSLHMRELLSTVTQKVVLINQIPNLLLFLDRSQIWYWKKTNRILSNYATKLKPRENLKILKWKKSRTRLNLCNFIYNWMGKKTGTTLEKLKKIQKNSKIPLTVRLMMMRSD